MAIEWSKKASRGRNREFGAAWSSGPSIRIVKGSLYLNQAFQTAFGINDGDYLFVGVDVSRKVVAFKKAGPADDYRSAYPAKRPFGNRSSSHGLRVNYSRPSAEFPDAIGESFPAQLNTGERVIESTLNGVH